MDLENSGLVLLIIIIINDNDNDNNKRFIYTSQSMMIYVINNAIIFANTYHTHTLTGIELTGFAHSSGKQTGHRSSMFQAKQ